MATYAPRLSLVPRARALTRARGATVAGLALLALVSILLRTQRMDVGFWIDEALSVGIADRPITDIPGILRQDGSPPLYYMVLNVWLAIAGRSEPATHALSLIFATAAIPVAWAMARSLFGDRAGWIAAALTATTPFLTQYAQETRMYSLVVLLGIVAMGAFLAAFPLRRGRRWTIAFALTLTALMYTHNWALFFGAACGIAWLVTCIRDRDRDLVREGLIGFGLVALLYAPWVPSLLFQAAHTGAPWGRRPGIDLPLRAPVILLKESPATALLIGGGIGLAALTRPRGAEARAVWTLVGVAAGTFLIAWAASQVSPAWATRYLAVGLPPLLLLAAAGVAHAGRLGLLALAIVLITWAGHSGPSEKSNVRAVTDEIRASLRPGDLVISTQPEQLPAIAYYLDDVPGLRWATLWGPVTDLGVTDWRDGVQRLERSSARRNLEPLLDRIRPGERLILIQPEIYDIDRWSAPWTRLVRLRSDEWLARVQLDGRFRVVSVRPMSSSPPHPNPVKATVFLRGAVR
jgi:hypothetical protein